MHPLSKKWLQTMMIDGQAVGHVEQVGVDRHRLDAAEAVRPRADAAVGREQLPAAEDLDALVGVIADEHAPAPVDRERAWPHQLVFADQTPATQGVESSVKTVSAMNWP